MNVWVVGMLIYYALLVTFVVRGFLWARGVRQILEATYHATLSDIHKGRDWNWRYVEAERQRPNIWKYSFCFWKRLLDFYPNLNFTNPFVDKDGLWVTATAEDMLLREFGIYLGEIDGEDS